jgi:glycosyltransferase involved in cell wall biosynthesis
VLDGRLTGVRRVGSVAGRGSSSGASDREGEQLRPVSASEPLTSVESTEPLRIFVASAADLLTDRAQHGEGLIAWQTFSALAERGHELVVCAREADLASDPPFDVVETGRRLRWESLEPLAHARHVRRLFDRYGGTASFDAVHWLFPQEPLCFVPPRDVSFVVGPRSLRWANGSGVSRPRRAGDLVRVVSTPIFATARRRALSRASHVLVSTPGAVVDVPPAERRKVSVQPFGVDLSRFRVESFPEAPTVLFIGRLDPVKRVTALVEAFGLLGARIPDARLVIAGEGPERPAIESARRMLRLDSSVELVGKVPHDDVPDLLATCTVLCLPSAGEPFGMVVLEAMASGRAVVAVRGGGPDSLVDPGLGGALAPSGTPAALAQALLDVLGDRETPRRMGAYNRRRATSEFGVARLAEALERCYRGDRPTVRDAPSPATRATAAS